YSNVLSSSVNLDTSELENLPPQIIVSKRTGLTTSENGTEAKFTLKLNKAPSQSVSINIESSDPAEVNVFPVSVVFDTDNWNTPQEIKLKGNKDHLMDGNKLVTIDLGYTKSKDPNFDNLSVGTVEVQNIDNDVPGITVSRTSGLIVSENGDTTEFTVSLNTRPTETVSIPIVNNDSSEVTISTTSLVFTPGNWNIPQTVTITGVDDEEADGDINSTISLGLSISDDPLYSGHSQDVNIKTIDNDTPDIMIINSNITTYESGTKEVFYVSLKSKPTGTVNIPLELGDETEGKLNKETLTFTIDSWNIAQAVTVEGLADDEKDGDITYFIQVGSPEGDDTVYNALAPKTVSVTNIDNDTPGFDVTPVIGSTSEDGDTAYFYIRLLTKPSAGVTLTLSSSNSSEGNISSSKTIKFSTTNWSNYQKITVRGINDNNIDGDIEYFIQSSTVVSSDPNYSGLNTPKIKIINIDNDSPGVAITVSGTPIVTSESGGTGYFTVRLRTKPTDNVVISEIKSSNPGAGIVSNPTLTFTQTNWSIPQKVTVSGVDNFYFNPEGILYEIHVPSPTSSDINYSGLSSHTIQCKNNDNDKRAYIFKRTTNLILAPGILDQYFDIKLRTQPVGGDVVIPVSSSDSSRIELSHSEIVFTASNWNEYQRVTIKGKPDNEETGNIEVNILLGEPNTAKPSIYYAKKTYSDYDEISIPDYNNVINDNGTISVNYCDTDVKIAICTPVASQLTTSEKGKGITYFVLLNKKPKSDVTFNISVSNPAEGRLRLEKIIKNKNNWNRLNYNSVYGVNDLELEPTGEQIDGNKTYSVIHGMSTSDDPYFNNIEVTDIENIVNIDDDKPLITFTPENASNNRIYLLNGKTKTIKLKLNAKPKSTVNFTLKNNYFEIIPSSFQFNSTNWKYDQEFTIRFTGNMGNSYQLNRNIVSSKFISSDNTDYIFNNKDPNDLFISVVKPGFIVGVPNGPTDELGSLKTFSVRLTAPPIKNVTIPIKSLNTSEIVIVSDSNLVFTPENWNQIQKVTFRGVDDSIPDGDRQVTIELGAAISEDLDYSGLDPMDVQAVNIDND
ncbi:MAG: hypothetical protein KDK36_12000, partial [Leptospiraceae bacterium]|nr:hypothetical protein [Leptospiraceae bacterium]